MVRRIYFLCLLLILSSSFAHAGVTIESFRISSTYLFTDDDARVMFTAEVNGPQDQRPKELTLFEADSTGLKARYRWALVDDGTLGDLKAQDGVYSRAIQFKEKKSRVIQFVVIPEVGGGGSAHQDLPAVAPHQTATLEIKNRPSMIEILGQVIKKIRNKI